MENIHLLGHLGLNLETAGLLLAFSHLMVLAAIILWFALDKPESLAQLRARLSAGVRRRLLPRMLTVRAGRRRARSADHTS